MATKIIRKIISKYLCTYRRSLINEKVSLLQFYIFMDKKNTKHQTESADVFYGFGRRFQNLQAVFTVFQ
jgi:hypothetical protein